MSLLNLCKNGDSDGAMEILQNPEKCKMNQVDDNGCTALIWACRNKMEKVALELLDKCSVCKIDQVDDNGCTALIWACSYCMEKVALKILEYRETYIYDDKTGPIFEFKLSG